MTAFLNQRSSSIPTPPPPSRLPSYDLTSRRPNLPGLSSHPLQSLVRTPADLPSGHWQLQRYPGNLVKCHAYHEEALRAAAYIEVAAQQRKAASPVLLRWYPTMDPSTLSVKCQSMR